MKNPVLPDGTYGGGIQIVLTGTPAACIQGEETVYEGAELWNIVWSAVELLMAEP